MATLVDTYAYVYVVLVIALDIGAVCLAYRLTTITGAFWGWMLMIAGVVLLTFQAGASSLVEAVTFFPLASVDKVIQDMGVNSFLTSTLIELAIAGTLFTAMLELNRTFEHLKR